MARRRGDGSPDGERPVGRGRRTPDRERPVGRAAAPTGSGPADAGAGPAGVDVPAALERVGGAIVRTSWAGTVAFALSTLGAVIAPDVLGGAFIAVALVLFTAGCAAFLWAYGIAVGRSRTDAIGIGGLFFLAGSAPPGVRRSLLGAVGVQCAVAILGASVRPFTGLAFGILVPVFGLGLTGLWGARHGVFPPRRPRRAS